MPETLYERIKKRQYQLEDERRPYEAVYQEVVEVLRPELSKWDDDTYASKGKKRNVGVYTAAPEEALENWSDGMQGHLVSSSLDWFGYMMSERRFNDLPVVRTWRQECTEVIYSIFRDSNFYPALGPVFRDVGSVGDTVLFMDRADGDTIDFKSFHPREVYHAPDIFHRKFDLTAMEAAKQFGEEKLSRSLQNDLKNNPFARHVFIQTCYAKGDVLLDGITGLPNRAYVSVYIQESADPDRKEPVRIGGYHSKPYAHWAYSLASDSEYGWGLGCSALVDVYANNETARTNMQAQQMAVDPPVMAHRSLRGRMNIRPHGVTYYDKPEQEVRTIFDRLNVPFGLDREDRLAAAIDRRFNVDFFLMLARAQKPMTATEIMERTGEKSILLGPKIGRMESYLLNPVHERVFSIAQSEGWLPPPPDILLAESNGKIDVEYLGPLAMAQKRLFEVRRNERTMASVSPLVQLNPQVVDNLDMDKSFVRILRSDDWPEGEIRLPEQVAAMRQQRAQQAAAMAQLEMAKDAADAVPKLQGETAEGSPLEAITQGAE